MEKSLAVCELEDLLCQLHDISEEARNIVSEVFPEELPACDAYDVFNFGSSVNPYDSTFEKLVNRLINEN